MAEIPSWEEISKTVTQQAAILLIEKKLNREAEEPEAKETDGDTRYTKVDNGVAPAGEKVTDAREADPIDKFISSVNWNWVLGGSITLLAIGVTAKVIRG